MKTKTVIIVCAVVLGCTTPLWAKTPPRAGTPGAYTEFTVQAGNLKSTISNLTEAWLQETALETVNIILDPAAENLPVSQMKVINASFEQGLYLVAEQTGCEIKPIESYSISDNKIKCVGYKISLKDPGSKKPAARDRLITTVYNLNSSKYDDNLTAFIEKFIQMGGWSDKDIDIAYNEGLNVLIVHGKDDPLQMLFVALDRALEKNESRFYGKQ
jgi:hypothetical protein